MVRVDRAASTFLLFLPTTLQAVFDGCENCSSHGIKLGQTNCCCFGGLVSYQVLENQLRCTCSMQQETCQGLALSEPSNFMCTDTKQVIPISQVNDQVCDCSDGSDEPDTSACSTQSSSGQFFCVNEGFKSEWIPSSKVDDGVCDCCDGSDEHDPTLVICAPTCESLANAENERIAREQEKRQRGWELRMEARTKAKEDAAKRKKLIEELKEESRSLEKHVLVPLKQCIREEEDQLRAFTRARHLEWSRIQARKYRLGTLNSVDDVEELQGEEGGIEEVTSTDPFPSGRVPSQSAESLINLFHEALNTSMTLAENGSFEDPKLVVPLRRFVQLKQDHLRVKVKPLFSKPVSERRKATLLQPFFSQGPQVWRKLAHYLVEAIGLVASPLRGLYELLAFVWNAVVPAQVTLSLQKTVVSQFHYAGVWYPIKQWLSQNGIQRIWYTFWDAGPTLYFYLMSESDASVGDLENPQLGLMRNAKSRLEELLKAGEIALKEEQKVLDLDVGPSEELATLFGKCFSKVLGGYSWNLCLFGEAKQNIISLGSFKKWDSEERDTMLYEGGAACWNGPKRSVKVRLSCEIENDILTVEEPTKCAYVLNFGTPLVCDLISIKEIKK